MEEGKSFDIKINTRYPLLHGIAMVLLFTALIGYGFLYLIDLPVKDQPELTIPYFFWLPQWLSDTVSRTALQTTLAFFLGLALLAIRKNAPGKMKILADRVEIKSNQSLTTLKYADLKRISFIKSSSINPYRILFLYKNSDSFRIRVPSELEMEEVLELFITTVPRGLELYGADIEEPDL